MAERDPEQEPRHLIRRLRKTVGSHDKLARQLRERREGNRARRQLIIHWEKGDTFPSQENAEVLAEIAADYGISARPADFRQGADRRRLTADRLERLVREAEKVADRLESLLDGLGGAPDDPTPPRLVR